nr:MAG TPA: protein of unknown function DUF2277 [Caudoviricetes sp.]
MCYNIKRLFIYTFIVNNNRAIDSLNIFIKSDCV